MLAFYSDHFALPLPAGHRFPMGKYARLREQVQSSLTQVCLTEPAPASDGVLALAHHPDYIGRLVRGELSAAQQRAIGFPWSAQLVERSRRSTGATIDASRAALRDGAAVNLAGGTHHAFSARGEGFCCFNDVVVAARVMQAERRVRQVAIVDLDVHQGDGSASILAGDPSVFTLSVHGERNYPFRKETSDLDVPLPDSTGDEAYLEALAAALATMQARCQPDLLIYLAGADVYEGDRLGRISLSRNGVARRDAMVFDHALGQRLPVAVVMGGGYSPAIDDIVAIHLETVRQAADHARAMRAGGFRSGFPAASGG